MYVHLPLSIFITSLCFDVFFNTFAASVYDTVTAGVAFWTTSLSVLGGGHSYLCIIIKIHAFKNIYDFIMYISLMESLLTLLLEAVWEEEAVAVLEEI